MHARYAREELTLISPLDHWEWSSLQPCPLAYWQILPPQKWKYVCAKSQRRVRWGKLQEDHHLWSLGDFYIGPPFRHIPYLTAINIHHVIYEPFQAHSVIDAALVHNNEHMSYYTYLRCSKNCSSATANIEILDFHSKLVLVSTYAVFVWVVMRGVNGTGTVGQGSPIGRRILNIFLELVRLSTIDMK